MLLIEHFSYLKKLVVIVLSYDIISVYNLNLLVFIKLKFVNPNFFQIENFMNPVIKVFIPGQVTLPSSTPQFYPNTYSDCFWWKYVIRPVDCRPYFLQYF